MSDFQLYLRVGFDHITDPNGYDHILFVMALCAVYQLKDWKKLLILVTAFTVGHSITLALATLKIVRFNTDLIEFLIPITILFTCLLNFFRKTEIKKDNLRYFFAVFFGLIHGLGFSNYLTALLGQAENITLPLFAFNVGLEIGQLAIVAATLLISFILISFLKVKSREWNLILSGAVAGVALTLVADKWIF
ncbi:HupE/UreJ family protein [Thermoflexibacter ruber]|uniref:HupE / UreJ protein n=1 Tax=Thermoflexibacter ruber TaxID=1003 RepID=A0A1I2E740_9BACT|nr:HupE/UreJ family protein [Thermoflexibacter ruber]SFE88527.1 HupE / UreJ protein [Thermoflexibacter ruber]